ncbi:MAG TPA: HDIG domain-containing protein [Tepidisphaeraceae bacterium]|jgi:hypothetical protein
MGLFRQIGPRRAEIRKNRPDRPASVYEKLLRSENQIALAIVVGFTLITAGMVVFSRPNVVPWRVGQFAAYDIVARVDFSYDDPEQLKTARQNARDREARVYKAVDDPLIKIAGDLKTLPEKVVGRRVDELDAPLKSILDNAAVGLLASYADNADKHAVWNASVDGYVKAIRDQGLIVLPADQRQKDAGRMINLGGFTARVDDTLSPAMTGELESRFRRPAEAAFPAVLTEKVIDLTLVGFTPNYELDRTRTTEAQNLAAARVPLIEGQKTFVANDIVAEKGELMPSLYPRLRAEHDAFIASLGNKIWWQRLGLAAAVILIIGIATFYVVHYQPRIVRNPVRALGLAALLFSMLLLAQLTGLGGTRSYVFFIAPTIMVAMILTIAYDRRFAFGIGVVHALLATIALGEGMNLLLVLLSGVATCCFLLDDVRTRSKLIEIGGAVSIVMMLATFATGWIAMDPMPFILRNAIYAGAAGLAVGFVVLGILPFVERAFRITTSMTLLELADASHPLLRRLAIEAPGTYNHSLQVATLSEEAAEAIGANSLLCRVASYYHDVGKINKADYFVENQQQGANRHYNLSPSVSLLIIIGHVKDGLELAKEYALPTSVVPFIQQHHGTTLVEFFYHRARNEGGMEHSVEEHQYRYPGPKPRTKEVAIVMLSDACESACRAMEEPNSSRIETLVHELAMKRLLDGQFDESDLTMRELELIERSLVKSLLGLYHGRIAYPTDKNAQARLSAVPTQPAVRTA